MIDPGADPNVRVFGSPHRYYQGPDALNRLPALCAGIGSKPLLVVDAGVLALLEGRLEKLFAGRAHGIASFQGEVTINAIDALAKKAGTERCDLIVGMGGGKALDAGKGCAIRARLRFVSVPTVASNDSPTATALAIYDDRHRIVAVESLDRNPEAVVVDTRLIAAAPPRFLLAGMGDAIAKKFEGEASQRHGGRNAHHSHALRTAGYIADGCYRTIREFGIAAMAAAGVSVPNEALEAVVEANILMAGLGFENMGLGIAHGLARGLVRVPGISDAPHGFHIAYGTLVLLAAEGRPDAFIQDLLDFYGAVGLPRSLAELGMTGIDPDVLRGIATSSVIAPEGAYLLMPVGADALVAAMEDIERFQFDRSQ
ncbi:glycerol dehydrogenase [Sphingobium sp.]|uniref:glycerol dehydrogenase n=1 Tax=Sphingobium sp. TaxID=1912891 RepID=UPI002CBE3266|nr:glycerol dehydrogenase [Sphingobium sp.]HUD93308.1 glycerol dehydrogenase [Sphingobium sp.]